MKHVHYSAPSSPSNASKTLTLLISLTVTQILRYGKQKENIKKRGTEMDPNMWTLGP